MNNITKKIVAIVTTVTCAVWMMGPGVANALTAAELQVMINDLLAQIATLQSQLSALEGEGAAITGCTITSFDRNLSLTMTGNDVKCLQITLNSASDTQVAASGVGSAGNETTYFGPLTKAAVIKFQEKYASEVLTPLGLTAGTGFVGVKTLAKLNSILTAGVPAEEVPVEEVPAVGEVTIALSADTPIAGGVAKLSQDVPFTKIKFTGGTTGVTVTKISVTRTGVSDDNDLADVKLFDGTTQLGSTQALSTLTHKAVFSSLSWAIPAGETKYLTIKGSIGTDANAGAGNSLVLGIAVAGDITSSVALAGTFPIRGNEKRIATKAVGQLDVDKQVSPATNTNMLSGATDQEIASWKFDASGAAINEAFDVHSIKITHVGSATRDDVKNIKLKVSGVQIGSTVASLDAGNAATFDLSASPLNIPSGATKQVYAYADIAAGIWTARTVIFEITQYTDVVAYGGDSGGIVTITYSDGTSYTKQTCNTMTIGQGTLTVALDAGLNPSAQTYVKGTSNRLMTAIKFTTGSTEGVRVVKLKLTQDGTSAAATDIANVTLWDGTTQVAGPASQVGTTVTFGSNTIGWDSVGLFDVEAGKTKTIQVKADVPSGADSTTPHKISLDVAASTDVWADGLDSKYDVPSGSISGSAEGAEHTIGAKGSLAVSLSASTPPAQTYVVGALEKEFTRINLTAGSGEDILVSAITLDILSNASVATSGAHLTKVKLVRVDTGAQFGTTVSSPTATANFSGNITVPASETVSLKAIADVPTTSYPVPNSSIEIASGVTSGTAITDALTSTGASSAQDITETGSADGKNITISVGTLTIATAPTPGDQTRIVGTAIVPIVGLTMTAGEAENVRLTSITLTMNSSGAEASTTDVSNIALYDGTTRLTSQKPLTASTETASSTTQGGVHHTVQFTASDFLNSLGIDITKGSQKTVTVKCDLPSTGKAHTFAFGVSSTDQVTVTGLLSNTEISETLTKSPNADNSTGVNIDTAGVADAANLYEITLATKGTIEIAANAGRPVTAIQAVGQEGTITTGIAFHKVDFTPSLENIYIKSVTVERATGDTPGASRDSDFGLISLWDGTTQLGSGQYLSNASTTFTFPEGSYWELAKGVTKILTIKAELNGIAATTGYGSNTGDSPLLRIDTVSEQGVSSGSTAISTIADSDLSGGYKQYIRQSKPTIAAASLPSTALTTGQKTLYRWTVTASDKGAIGWRRVAFNITGTMGGMAIQSSSTAPYSGGSEDGIYIANTSPDPDVMTKMINDFKVYNLTDDPTTAITVSTTDYVGWTVTSTLGGWLRSDTDANTGYYFIFVPGTEEVIAAGETKTYELKATILSGKALAAGDAVLIKLDALSSSATTSYYSDVSRSTAYSGGFVSEDKSWMNNYATSSVSFIWTDRSASSHALTTSDWTNDYKVSGLPAITLSLEF